MLGSSETTTPTDQAQRSAPGENNKEKKRRYSDEESSNSSRSSNQKRKKIVDTIEENDDASAQMETGEATDFVEGNVGPAKDAGKNANVVNPSSALGHAAAQGIALVNALKNAGADHDLQLPRIVFAGKQSAGKSSLVEAVTGIALPRAHGTCTKCPIEVTTERVENGDPNFWECDVSLRIMYGENGDEKESPENFKVCEITAEQKSEMPEKIKEAQEEILEKSGDGKQKFTKNTICVHIRGRECQNLSIVDLPGLIQSVDKAEDERYIILVEGLVNEYLQSPNTVILQCFQSDEDIENQKIRTLARETDPEGRRSLGVLTKPDKIEKGTEDSVMGMLRGDLYELQWGYFIVRCPRQDELKKLEGMEDLSQAEKERYNIENDFFSSDDLGRKLRDAKPECCGSNKLLVKLSSMLHDMINEQVPDMRTKLEKLLCETNKGIDDLGVSVSKEDSSEALNRIIQLYSDAVTEHVKTSKNVKGFWQQSKLIFFDLAKSLKKAAPTFEVGGRAVFEGIVDVQEASEGDWSHTNSVVLQLTKEQVEKMEKTTFPQFELDDATWEATCEWKKEFSHRHLRKPFVSLSVVELDEKIHEVDIQFQAIAAGSGNKTAIASDIVSVSLARGNHATTSSYVKNLKEDDLRIILSIRVNAYIVNTKSENVYTVGDVKKMIDEAKGRELAIPGPAGYESSVIVIGKSVRHWHNPAQACVDSIHSLMQGWFVKEKERIVNQAVPEKYRLIRDEMGRIVSKMLDQYKAKCMKEVTFLWQMEENEFTTNEHYMVTNRRKYRAIVDKIISGNDLDTKLQSLDSVVKANLNTILGSLGLSAEKLKLIPSSSTFDDEAIDTIAGALAYIRVALKRFQDVVPLHIQFHMIDRFAKECEDVLKKEFGVFQKSPEELHFFFQEDSRTEQRRKNLRRRKERQERALELILDHEKRAWSA